MIEVYADTYSLTHENVFFKEKWQTIILRKKFYLYHNIYGTAFDPKSVMHAFVQD